MSGRPSHVLLVGGGNGAFLAHRPETRTTFVTSRELLTWFGSLGHHARVLAIQGDEPDDLVVEMVRTIHGVDPFDAVACLGEPLTVLAARIATALDLPGVPPLSVVRRIVDKESMRTHLAEAGVETVRARTVESPAELAAIVGAGHPEAAWIVKPAAGCGSLGVSKVTRDSDLEAALRRASDQESPIDPDRANRRVIVEPFLSGPQFSVESISQHGVTSVLAITQKFSHPETFVELGHVVPAQIPDAEAEVVRSYVVRMLDALGFTDGPAHTEVVLTSDGPRIVEVNARLGGDDIGQMASIVSGVDLSAASIDLVLGEPVQERLRNAAPSGTSEAIWFVTAPEAGIFAGLDGVEDARALGPSVEVTALVQVGAPVELLSDSGSRVAQVRASAASAEEALSLAQRAAWKLNLRIAKRVPAQVGAEHAI
ncbi:ATP-grasp domain-containing protein [Micromonospora sp. NPDC003241]